MLANSGVSPVLNTHLVEPMHFLEKLFLERRESIAKWFAEEWRKTLPPVYGSVDLRNAGFKIAPVDMNLFPAGFNNLNPNYLSIAGTAAKEIIEEIIPQAHRVLIVPESHTRNIYYWENMQTLKSILIGAGFDVRFGMLDQEELTVTLSSGEKLVGQPLLRENDELFVANFNPDVVLLNNDLSAGVPEILQKIRTLIVPPVELGWSQRLKSEHFQYYAEVTAEFGEKFHFDPWLIAPLFRHCGEIDFMGQEGLDCLIANAEIMFAAIQKKYQEYNISYHPFLIVKADAGTYGMAVMTVRNVDELKNMNRKQRTRMSTIKGGQSVNRVIIQEGVYTFETFGSEQAVTEPVVYLWGGKVVGGFYRVHQGRGVDENLNAPGMQFEPLPFVEPCHEPCGEADPDACQNRFYAYGIIALLSMLAAAREIRDQKNS